MAKISIIAYLLPILIALLLSLTDLLHLIRKRKDLADGNLENIKNDKYTIEQLQKEDIYMFSWVKKIFGALFVAFNFPVLLLRMALISRFGQKLVWKLPVSFYELWSFLFIWFAYKAVDAKDYKSAIIFDGLVMASVLFAVSYNLTKKDGRLMLMTLPLHKLSLRSMLEQFVIIIMVFGSINYLISSYYPDAFPTKLSYLDSIYYSITTIATVGYGDIHPLHEASKIASMAEILIGYLFAVIFIAVFINVYLVKMSTGNTVNKTGEEAK